MYMKVYAGIWMYMVEMRVYESVWSSMMVYECIWKRMNIYETKLWFMKVYDKIWV